LNFDDLIDVTDEFSRKRKSAQHDELWDPHTKNKFEQSLHYEDKWLVWRLRNEPSEFESTKGRQISLQPPPVDVVMKDFAWRVSVHPQVENVVSTETDTNEFDIWTIIRDFDEETEQKIAEAEVELVKNNPDLRFDFMIIPRRGRDLAKVIPKGSNVLYSKKQVDKTNWTGPR